MDDQRPCAPERIARTLKMEAPIVNVFSATRRELEGHFVPDYWNHPDQSSAVPLHAALRQALHTSPNWALVCYWNHRELTSLVEQVHAVLDGILTTRFDRGTHAIGWSLQPDRTEGEVVELLRAAERAVPELAVIAAVGRVRMPRMGAEGKPRNVICTEFAHLHQQHGRQYVELIRSVVGSDEKVPNAEIVSRLDEQFDGARYSARTLKPDPVALALCSCWGKALKTPLRENFTTFVADLFVSEPAADLTDDWLLQRLTEPIPDLASNLEFIH